MPHPAIHPRLVMSIQSRIAEYDQIPPARHDVLRAFSEHIQALLAEERVARLSFVCTHNSRRSQMAQLWAAAAATYYGIDGISTYSGGTEATAFNPRAVEALRRAGFDIDRTTADVNAIYHARVGPTTPPITCFSKVYDHAPNPTVGFCAVMTCAQADRHCPLIAGATYRIAIPFEDPKVADGSPEEASTYDARCLQIGREMLYTFSLVHTALQLPASAHASPPFSK